MLPVEALSATQNREWRELLLNTNVLNPMANLGTSMSMVNTYKFIDAFYIKSFLCLLMSWVARKINFVIPV